MLDRRRFNIATVAFATSVSAPWAFALAKGPDVNDDGLHVQPWFLQSFLDLREDHQEAKDAGKRFVIIWEQKGCPYCREMHAVNFQKKQIVEFITSRFNVLQLNMWGARKVTDFDGEELEERQLARKWAINFTPTTVFFGSDAAAGKSGKALEVARMPGYFKPFHFFSMYEFVDQDAYKSKGFQRYLQDKFKDLEAKGIKPKVW